MTIRPYVHVVAIALATSGACGLAGAAERLTVAVTNTGALL